jgi:YgiT-type zinc finger domain-containing protein
MCTFCDGYLKESKTDYIEKNENHVILIRDVPCEECEQCGETYFSDQTVKTLEKILGRIQHISSEITLTVLDYVKSAA